MAGIRNACSLPSRAVTTQNVIPPSATPERVRTRTDAGPRFIQIVRTKAIAITPPIVRAMLNSMDLSIVQPILERSIHKSTIISSVVAIVFASAKAPCGISLKDWKAAVRMMLRVTLMSIVISPMVTGVRVSFCA